jgi:hypothetical protein
MAGLPWLACATRDLEARNHQLFFFLLARFFFFFFFEGALSNMERGPLFPAPSSPSISPGATSPGQLRAAETGTDGGVGTGIALRDFATGSPLGGAGDHSPRPGLRRRASLASTSSPDEIEGTAVSGPGGRGVGMDKESADMKLLGQVLEDNHLNTDTYEVAELRDGFFDALFFLKPAAVVYEELMKGAEKTLPAAFDKKSPLSAMQIFPRQWHEVQSFGKRVMLTTRSRIQLGKSFGAFFVAYVLCLVPVVRSWLGRYNYIMVISTIVNHPARTVGSQIDGAILTTVGTASGLGWGVVGLLLSTSTPAAGAGYGGILAVFLGTFMVAIAWIRSYFIRMYQLALCAGMAIIYTSLSEVNGKTVRWEKLYAYAVPWMLGQAISLLVCVLVFPDAGARPLAETYHSAFGNMLDGLVLPRVRNTRLRRRLAQTFVDLSTAYRDMRIDITIMRFHPDDVGELRNRMQGVIRGLLSLKTETRMFDDWDALKPKDQLPVVSVAVADEVESRPTGSGGFMAEGGGTPETLPDSEEVAGLVARTLVGPTTDLLNAMRDSIKSCDAVFMDLSGYRLSLGPPNDVSSDVGACQVRLKTAMSFFDQVEGSILASGELPATYTGNPEVIDLLVFARHVRLAAGTIYHLMDKVHEMQFKSDLARVYFPSYPLWKALNRTNAQVRHDRGGVTAGESSSGPVARSEPGSDQPYSSYRLIPHNLSRNREPGRKDHGTGI